MVEDDFGAVKWALHDDAIISLSNFLHARHGAMAQESVKSFRNVVHESRPTAGNTNTAIEFNIVTG